MATSFLTANATGAPPIWVKGNQREIKPFSLSETMKLSKVMVTLHSETIFQGIRAELLAQAKIMEEALAIYRGEDTRRGFVSHLYRALCQKPLNTFIDSEDLRKGDRLSELLTAIRESRLSIVVFSQSYASSTWCLKELVQILECNDNKNQIIVPIFYEVDPSDIRRLKGNFAEGFAKHERHSHVDVKEVQSWRDDAELIEKIVEDVFKKLIYNSSTSTKDNGLVGMDSHMHKMHLILHPRGVETNTVHVVGIWVLIVVDDVDKLEQIEALLGEQHSFGGGSRIIITTRDLQLLGRTNATYQPKIFSDSGALELFRRYAFRNNQPTKDYDHLSRHAIQYAQGLPLALKVLGAFLDNKTVSEWENVLEKIRKIPLRGVHDVLKTSFDGLDDTEKNIFLDIACFFKGMDKDYATEILDGCGFYPRTGITVLINRALITVSEEGKLEMHDLLEEMGREIVRQESIKDPGKRSRLWNYEDVHRVLTQNTATEAVESIILDLSNSCEVRLNPEAFVSMTQLRLLKISHEKYQFFNDDCCKFLSSDRIDRLWEGTQSLPSNIHMKSLETFDVSGCSNLEMFLEISEVMEKLSVLNLSESKVKELPSSIHNLTGLRILVLQDCKELQSLPSSIHMKSLNTLDLCGCSNLEMFPEISEVMENLSVLNLSESKVKELPSSINNLTRLRFLVLKDCKELKSLPSSIHMKSLKTLDLSGCSSLEMFSEISEVMEELSYLNLSGSKIIDLSSSISNLKRLCWLDLQDCKELKSLPSSICQLKSLRYVSLSGCTKFEAFPSIEENMKELRELHLDGTCIRELSPWIERLQGLVILNLRNCESLLHLPDTLWNLAHLSALNVCGCSNLSQFPLVLNSEDLERLWDSAVGMLSV
ncbi:protein suppressor of npr1-1 [Pyrus ussuriensis x Pyrus communis]|uniref:Protein suppressor of npr1-1 n=1 Tax=Pyrus ussuriensis x Pyrus communis TaxID=2448454 RepID=A0A5N5F601_9ROSA|nr:protein suppressor of npr1-1 [Pyrus ussuriensis x Pyrus communis]